MEQVIADANEFGQRLPPVLKGVYQHLDLATMPSRPTSPVSSFRHLYDSS
jgi:hypothetical protein